MLTISFFSAIIAGTPLLFATLGEILTETGNLNLGVEGMMLMGAVMGFGGLSFWQSLSSSLGAMLAGAMGAGIYLS